MVGRFCQRVASHSQNKSTCSHTIVASPHCHIADPDCADVLLTAYQTLLHATLITWTIREVFPLDNFVAFVQRVLENLPSSSTNISQKSQNVALFCEMLVDIIWAVDVELDEIITGSRSVLSAPPRENEDHAETLAKAEKAKQKAESDKETLAAMTRKLLVRGSQDYNILIHVHLILCRLRVF